MSVKCWNFVGLLILSIFNNNTQAAKHKVKIKFSSNISSKHRKTMDRDLGVLEEVNFSNKTDPRTLKVLGINQLNAHTAVKWLEDRVQYVIESTPSNIVKNKIKIEERFYQFENPRVFPELEVKSAMAQKETPVVVMSNTGAAIYHMGKTIQSLYSYPIQTGFFKTKNLKISSPRSGLIMIGEGHFLKRLDYDKKNRKAKANSYNRLVTFFHEARHSDGSGKHLSFFHALCPKGHNYVGLNACDRNLNGPYSVGAQMVREFILSCKTCSTEVIEVMKLDYLNNLGRIITHTKIPLRVDHSKISMLRMIINSKKAIIDFVDQDEKKKLKKEIADLQLKIKNILANRGKFEVIPSVYLPSKPEGVRIN